MRRESESSSRIRRCVSTPAVAVQAMIGRIAEPAPELCYSAVVCPEVLSPPVDEMGLVHYEKQRPPGLGSHSTSSGLTRSPKRSGAI